MPAWVCGCSWSRHWSWQMKTVSSGLGRGGGLLSTSGEVLSSQPLCPKQVLLPGVNDRQIICSEQLETFVLGRTGGEARVQDCRELRFSVIIRGCLGNKQCYWPWPSTSTMRSVGEAFESRILPLKCSDVGTPPAPPLFQCVGGCPSWRTYMLTLSFDPFTCTRRWFTKTIMSNF